MGYCDPADLVADLADTEIKQLTDDDGVAVDTVFVQGQIDHYSAIIDGYLPSDVTKPVTDSATLAILKPICLVLVRYGFYRHRDLKMDPKEDPVRVEYDNAIRKCEAFAKDGRGLPASAWPDVALDKDDEGACWGSEDPVFTSGGLL